MPESILPSDKALLRVAIDAFGRRGLEGASTRDIAAAAGKPMSAITYHFGGKDGLYLACATHIAETIGTMLSPALEQAEALSDNGDAASARAALATIFHRLVFAMVRPETAIFARFIVREQMEPSAAFDILYGGVMGRVMDLVAALLTRLSGGRLGPVEVRVRSIAMVGQVMAFRVARAAVLRATGWADVGAVEADAIDAVVQAHLTAILDRLEAGEDQ
jgi:AcrR family transcriptional regulator